MAVAARDDARNHARPGGLSMTAELQLCRHAGVVLAGIVRAGVLTDLLTARQDRESFPGSVHLGRVTRLDQAAGAAFVDIGLERPAFLPLRRDGAAVRAGDRLIVQTVNDAREEKGAEVTRDIALPGRWLVHVPGDPGVGVSRRLGPEAKRRWKQRLAAGWVVRAGAEAMAATPHGLEAVEAEAAALRWLWAEIGGAATGAQAPALLAPGPGPARRLLLDHPDIARLRIEPGNTDPALPGWLARWRPELSGAGETGQTELVEAVVPLLAPLVPLPSGGLLAIEPTRAFVAVDVDAGGASDPLAVNREAVLTLARQMRLRNLGGLLVVDLLRMKRPTDRALLLEILHGVLADDPAGARAATGLTDFGLAEITRPRRGPALHEVFDRAP